MKSKRKRTSFQLRRSGRELEASANNKASLAREWRLVRACHVGTETLGEGCSIECWISEQFRQRLGRCGLRLISAHDDAKRRDHDSGNDVGPEMAERADGGWKVG